MHFQAKEIFEAIEWYDWWRVSNYLSEKKRFEERQLRWMERKEQKLCRQKVKEEIDEVKECTFVPEILSPEGHKHYDPEFYERQLEWYVGVLENVECNKEKIYHQVHKDPETFTSPFVEKDDIPVSRYHEYFNNTGYSFSNTGERNPKSSIVTHQTYVFLL